MPGRASIAFALLFGIAAAARAQSTTAGEDPFTLGRAAMDAHDPARAITYFERVDSRQGRAWLAVALMMESRSPADGYVARAFEAAALSRSEQPQRVRPRAEIAAALPPGQMVIAFLAGESHAYAWAFDHDTFIGYPLPPPADLATAVERIKSYAGANDRAGVERIAEDLVPALFGPVLERVPSLTRIIFVVDGPLQGLPFGELPLGDGKPRIADRLAISTVTDADLLGEIARTPAAPASQPSPWTLITIAFVAAALLLVVRIVARRKRSSVA